MEFGKKIYTLKETYWIAYKAFRTAKYLYKAKRRGDLSSELIERIMLAVTEVNGCGICAYAHTKMALEAGMSNSEIQNVLAGVTDDIPLQEVAAVMFAQHYADCRGIPSIKAWEHIVETYGPVKAQGILGAVRTIMLGNALGIAWIAFSSRLKGKADPRSSLVYELAMLSGSVVFIPIALIHAGFSALLRSPIISFSK